MYILSAILMIGCFGAIAYFLPEKSSALRSIAFSATFFFIFGNATAVALADIADASAIATMTLYTCGAYVMVTLLITTLSGYVDRKSPMFDTQTGVSLKTFPVTNLLPDLVNVQSTVKSTNYGLIDTDAFHIRLGTAIDDDSLESFSKACVAAAASDKKRVRIEIRSHGGQANAAFAMCSYVKELSKTHDVYVCVIGICSSAAVLLLTSVPVENRVCNTGAEFLLHGVSGTDASSMQKTTERYIEHVTSGSLISVDNLHALMKGRSNCILNADEAHRAGLIGTVI